MATVSSPHICLVMIVRNESAVMERLLQTVTPIISSWRIIDTGSTDGTPALIERLLQGIPGELRHESWTDFATNRTQVVEWASGAGEWLLLLDADMTIEVDDDFEQRLSGFTSDAAQLQVVGGVRYRMPYLVRGGLPWRYLGRTHEHLACSVEYSSGWFDALRVHHHADGASHEVKLERDLELLGADLEENPDNPRTLFYLAQTHKDLGNDLRAIELYGRRAGLGGWGEEVFWSLYQQGLAEQRLERNTARLTLASAWDFRPTRAEPAYHLARINRVLRKHHLAWVWANVAAAIPLPSDTLFVEEWVYRWGAHFELADAAWRIGHKEIAREHVARLLEEVDLPSEHRQHAELILRNTGESE